MGIRGLLPEMHNAMTHVTIDEMAGKNAAVDVSCWIYKALGGKCDVRQFIFRRVNMLKHHNVNVILVFDGPEPPAKRDLIKLRRRSRLKAKDPAKESKLLRRMITRSVSLQDTIKQFCRIWGISYVISPFEADAQMAYMMKTGEVQFVITEDSDLIVYECDEILFKMKNNGKGDLFKQSEIAECWRAPYNVDIFRAVCIIMGCDYVLGGIKRFGPRKACRIYRKLFPVFDYDTMVQLTGLPIPAGFKEKFDMAVNTFKYQLAYDKNSQTIVPLTPYPNGMSETDFPYAGDPILAEGDHFDPEDGEIKLPQGKPCQQSYPCLECAEAFQHKEVRKTHQQEVHPHQCPICQKIFSSKYHLKDHKLRHGGKKTVICMTCGKALWTKMSLRIHLRAVHEIDSRACTICGKAFRNSFILDSHMWYVHNGRQHKCDKCGKAFKNKRTLASHVIFIHSFHRSFKCEICNEAFKTKTIRTTHMKSCTNQRSYICSFCPKAFNNLQNVEYHERTHTGERPYICQFCGKACKRIDELKSHEYRHQGIRRYICDVTKETCDKRFFTSKELKEHIRTHTGEKPYMCPYCERGFAQHSGRKDHMLVCKKRPIDNEPLPFECSYCEKRFATSSQKKRHERTHTGEKPYKCDYCAQDFADSTVKNTHMLTCKNRPSPNKPLPHKCSHCDKSFATWSRKTEHENIHTGDKPFKCEYCGIGFHIRYSKYCHMKNSCKDRPNITNELPHKCTFCEKSFAKASDKTSHERTHTGEKPYNCVQCGKGFTQNGSMHVHMKKSCPNRPSTSEH